MLSESTGIRNEARDNLLKVLDEKIKETGEDTKRAWLVTCAPPLVLLGLGFCIAWIIRGFRPRKPASTS